MKKLFLKVLPAMLSVFLLAGCGNTGETTLTGSENGNENTQSAENTQTAGEAVAGTEENQTNNEQTELLNGKHIAKIQVKDMGTITVELDADTAPITVTNFVNLAESGFYDGITFHRIIKDFMMQGGDPLGNGTGGSEQTITGEFASNGVENPLSHTRGAISMARNNFDMNSASSQFFIVHQDSLFLDGEYATFGYVTEGMDIVDAICEQTTGQDVNGVVPMENRPVIETIEIVKEAE